MLPDPLNRDCHNHHGFREQIAGLFLAGYEKRNDGLYIQLLRSFLHVCKPATASFSTDDPGSGCVGAWEAQEDLIDNQNMHGIFHTHPAGSYGWSGQDIRAQNGLAKAYGAKMLWHGVQMVFRPGVETLSHFVCTHMLEGRVFRYDYGEIHDRLHNPVIVLKVPKAIEWHDGDSCYELEA